jgi:hypothetical protein
VPPLYMRDLPGVSLKELAELVEPEHQTETYLAERVHFPADITSGILVRDQEGGVSKTLPPTGAYAAFGEYLDISSSLLARLDDAFVSDIYNRLLTRTRGPIKVVATPTVVKEVYAANERRIERSSVVAVAERVIPDGTIIDYEASPSKFYLDLVAPEDHRAGHITARGEPQEGDYCSGGLRFEMHAHRVPTVEEFFYRLVCTNGLQGRSRGAQASARGSLDQFLVEFEHLAEVRFRSVEETIEAYYHSRTIKVPNIEQALARHAQEHRLPASALQHLIELVPEWFHDEHGRPVQTTDQFTLANYITNQALNTSKFPPAERRRMEAMGGAVASDHTHRCPACLSRLN